MATLLYLFLILSLFCGPVHARGDLKQLKENKAFIQRFGNGGFEIVQPKIQESTIVLNSRLQLNVQINDFTFSRVRNLKNCFYQGRVEGLEDSFVALSTCYGIRGVISFENGTSYGIWPLNRSTTGKSGSHVLYPTRFHSALHNGGESTRKAHKLRSKYINVELAIEDITEFDDAEDKAMFYMLDATNIADLITSRFMNIRLNAWPSNPSPSADVRADLKVTMTAAKSLNKRARSSFIGKVCDVAEKSARVRAVDAPFTTHATADAFADVVSESVGVPLNLECTSANPFCLVGVIENRRCLQNYPPETVELTTTTIPTTTQTIRSESRKKAYHVESTTILIVMSCVGAFLFILLIVLHLTYRRMTPKEEKTPKEVTIAAPRKRVITFGEMPSYKSEQRRETKNRKVFEALEQKKTEVQPKDNEVASIASTQGSSEHPLHI